MNLAQMLSIAAPGMREPDSPAPGLRPEAGDALLWSQALAASGREPTVGEPAERPEATESAASPRGEAGAAATPPEEASFIASVALPLDVSGVPVSRAVGSPPAAVAGETSFSSQDAFDLVRPPGGEAAPPTGATSFSTHVIPAGRELVIENATTARPPFVGDALRGAAPGEPGARADARPSGTSAEAAQGSSAGQITSAIALDSRSVNAENALPARFVEAEQGTGAPARRVPPAPVIERPDGRSEARLGDVGSARAQAGGAKGGVLPAGSDVRGVPQPPVESPAVRPTDVPPAHGWSATGRPLGEAGHRVRHESARATKRAQPSLPGLGNREPPLAGRQTRPEPEPAQGSRQEGMPDLRRPPVSPDLPTLARGRSEHVDAPTAMREASAPAATAPAEGGTDTPRPTGMNAENGLTARVLEVVHRIARLRDSAGSVSLKVSDGQGDETTIVFQRRGESLAIRIVAHGGALELLGKDLHLLRESLQNDAPGSELHLLAEDDRGEARRRPDEDSRHHARSAHGDRPGPEAAPGNVLSSHEVYESHRRLNVWV